MTQLNSQQPLTQKQAEILRFILSQPIPPTHREIGAEFGIQSPNGVASHLRALENKGYLQRLKNRSRGLKPLVQTEEIRLETMTIEIDSTRQEVTITLSQATLEQKRFTFTSQGMQTGNSPGPVQESFEAVG